MALIPYLIFFASTPGWMLFLVFYIQRGRPLVLGACALGFLIVQGVALVFMARGWGGEWGVCVATGGVTAATELLGATFLAKRYSMGGYPHEP